MGALDEGKGIVMVRKDAQGRLWKVGIVEFKAMHPGMVKEEFELMWFHGVVAQTKTEPFELFFRGGLSLEEARLALFAILRIDGNVQKINQLEWDISRAEQHRRTKLWRPVEQKYLDALNLGGKHVED